MLGSIAASGNITNAANVPEQIDQETNTVSVVASCIIQICKNANSFNLVRSQIGKGRQERLEAGMPVPSHDPRLAVKCFEDEIKLIEQPGEIWEQYIEAEQKWRRLYQELQDIPLWQQKIKFENKFRYWSQKAVQYRRESPTFLRLMQELKVDKWKHRMLDSQNILHQMPLYQEWAAVGQQCHELFSKNEKIKRLTFLREWDGYARLSLANWQNLPAHLEKGLASTRCMIRLHASIYSQYNERFRELDQRLPDPEAYAVKLKQTTYPDKMGYNIAQLYNCIKNNKTVL